ncbi:cytochrome c oxidase assembly protein cox19 [Lasallia pustulata]|uniref:Cytochrome c oxidase assembly protein cox19 n=1 Tax=Lasallia pustulata TaxID=136370 RepID=A0A1W5CSE0_9LECA|nr:cytochrome c oxidase assembly protein cox19 [Lasallia pustulata]
MLISGSGRSVQDLRWIMPAARSSLDPPPHRPGPKPTNPMSFGGPGGRQISTKPTPPERGSFPLDHDGLVPHIPPARASHKPPYDRNRPLTPRSA